MIVGWSSLTVSEVSASEEVADVWKRNTVGVLRDGQQNNNTVDIENS